MQERLWRGQLWGQGSMPQYTDLITDQRLRCRRGFRACTRTWGAGRFQRLRCKICCPCFAGSRRAKERHSGDVAFRAPGRDGIPREATRERAQALRRQHPVPLVAMYCTKQLPDARWLDDRAQFAPSPAPTPPQIGGRFVFPSLLTCDRPMSDNTINAALRRLGYGGDVQTGHGFRSMASTLLKEQSFPPDVI